MEAHETRPGGAARGASATAPSAGARERGGALQEIYRHRFAEADRVAKDRVWSVVVSSFLQRWVPRDATVLDIGCGFGEFLNHIRCRARIGVDLNPDASEVLDADIDFHIGDVRDLSFLDEGSVDIAFTSNLLEHMPTKEDVDGILREARRVLRPGGHLIALGPNLRFLPGVYWDFWDHHTAITDRSLVEALENLDFRIDDCIPRFLPYTTRSSLPRAPWMIRLYLRMPIAWRLLGKQFLIRARKPCATS